MGEKSRCMKELVNKANQNIYLIKEKIIIDEMYNAQTLSESDKGFYSDLTRMIDEQSEYMKKLILLVKDNEDKQKRVDDKDLLKSMAIKYNNMSVEVLELETELSLKRLELEFLERKAKVLKLSFTMNKDNLYELR